jgi:hypothetical protein
MIFYHLLRLNIAHTQTTEIDIVLLFLVLEDRVHFYHLGAVVAHIMQDACFAILTSLTTNSQIHLTDTFPVHHSYGFTWSRRSTNIQFFTNLVFSPHRKTFESPHLRFQLLLDHLTFNLALSHKHISQLLPLPNGLHVVKVPHHPLDSIIWLPFHFINSRFLGNLLFLYYL